MASRARVQALGQPGRAAVGAAVLDAHAPAGRVDFVPADVDVQVLARVLAILQPARLGPEAEVGVAGLGEDATTTTPGCVALIFLWLIVNQ